jgi:hypothetical protein
VKHRKTDFGYVVRLQKGEEVIGSLTRFAEAVDLRSGGVTGIGTVHSVDLGYFESSTKEYTHVRLDDEFELISLTGNFSTVDGKMLVHAHVALSDRQCRAFGGHLFSGVVAMTAEFVVVQSQGEIARSLDSETGLKLLDV